MLLHFLFTIFSIALLSSPLSILSLPSCTIVSFIMFLLFLPSYTLFPYCYHSCFCLIYILPLSRLCFPLPRLYYDSLYWSCFILTWCVAHSISFLSFLCFPVTPLLLCFSFSRAHFCYVLAHHCPLLSLLHTASHLTSHIFFFPYSSYFRACRFVSCSDYSFFSYSLDF